MDETDIKQKADNRRKELGLSYAGAVDPEEAHFLAEKTGGVIVDVRTNPEFQYVGRIPGAIEINWQVYPDMTVNENFLAELERLVPKDKTVLFVCRSGVRSHHAATVAAETGWDSAYNVLEGFEGDLDELGRRNTTNGWRRRGLPWAQS